jgi:hypothetical protein
MSLLLHLANHHIYRWYMSGLSLVHDVRSIVGMCRVYRWYVSRLSLVRVVSLSWCVSRLSVGVSHGLCCVSQLVFVSGLTFVHARVASFSGTRWVYHWYMSRLSVHTCRVYRWYLTDLSLVHVLASLSWYMSHLLGSTCRISWMVRVASLGS